MALSSERHRWPNSSNSSSSRASPVPRVIKKASSSPTLLDSILATRPGQLSPRLGFGFANAYRNSPSSPNQSPASSSSACSTPPEFTNALVVQGSLSGRATPQSPLAPIPLHRSWSAPTAGWSLEADDMQVDAEGFPCLTPQASDLAWQCPGCHTAELPQPNRDSQMTCVSCGTGVSGNPRMVDGVRQSNGPREEAHDQVADAPGPTPEQTFADSVAEGGEDRAHRRMRTLCAEGGTRVRSARGHRGAEIRRGDRVVKSNVQSEVLARVEGSGPEARKNADMLGRLEEMLNKFTPPLHRNLLRHIRLESTRVVSAFFKHDAACGPGCGVTQTGASAKMLASCLLEGLMSKLCAEHNLGATAKHAPGMTKEQFEQAIAQVRAPKSSRGSGSMNRQQVLASVGLFLRWSDAQICQPCPPPPAPVPPQLRGPADRQGADYGCGRVIAPNPHDPMEKLRLSVNRVGNKVLRTPPEARNKALAALWDQKVVDFLSTTTMPVEIVTACLINAVSGDESDERDTDKIKQLACGLCAQYQVAEWSLWEFAKQLSAVLPTIEEDFVTKTTEGFY